MAVLSGWLCGITSGQVGTLIIPLCTVYMYLPEIEEKATDDTLIICGTFHAQLYSFLGTLGLVLSHALKVYRKR